MSLTEHQARMVEQARLIDEAAERAYEAVFDGALAEDGHAERELWRNAVRAVLETPGLMVTGEDIEKMTKTTMERTAVELRKVFVRELRMHADNIETTARLCPDHADSPGLITAAQILRKVADK